MNHSVIQNAFNELSPIFSLSAVECIDALFGKKGEIHMDWQIVEQLQAQFDIIFTMGSSNTEYSSITCAGIQYDSLRELLGQAYSPELATGALSEFVNSYCAMLNDNEQFKNHFGILTQAVPVLYTDGQSFLPFIWGIHGYIYFGTHWIYVGYSLRSGISDKKECTIEVVNNV